MGLLWNGDLETGDLSQYGGWEFGGTFDGTPPLSQRVTVAAQIDGVAPAQGSKLIRVQCAPGDNYGNSTGWRTLARQHEPIQSRAAGYDSSYTLAMRVPAGYPGDAGIWTAGVEMHGPGGVVANHHLNLRGNDVFVDIYGGQADNTLKTTYVNQAVLAGYAKDAWHVFVFRYKVGSAPSGHYELWHGQLGQDTTLTQLISAPNIGTVYDGASVYPLFFLYRPQTGVTTLTAYFDALREYSTLAEAKTFAEAVLQAGGVSPPPPAPSLAQVGAWTTPLIVNSRTLAPVPTTFTTWTSPRLVRAFAAPSPAPNLPHEGAWTTPARVASRGQMHQSEASTLIPIGVI